MQVEYEFGDYDCGMLGGWYVEKMVFIEKLPEPEQEPV
jgi:hypothetical protein